MHNVWRLFKDDVRHLFSNVVTIIIVLGLVALPSIFSWYNIIACWDVFGNTGNLTVAVANTDEGYTSDLVPIEINIGDRVTSALRANDQLDWVFTSQDDAIDGVRSGNYYAAVVIPSTFSSDMMSFYSDDMEHARITYYSNQKKSAIAPKVTDQGADQVSSQVNEVFAETLSEIALSVASALVDYTDEADIDGRMGDLSSHLGSISGQLDDAAATLASYSSVIGSAEKLVSNSGELLSDARGAAQGVDDSAHEAKDATKEALNALDGASAALASALSDTASDYGKASDSVSNAFDQAQASSIQAETTLRRMAEQLRSSGQTAAATALDKSADAVKDANAQTQASRAAAEDLANTAKADLQAAKAGYEKELKPKLDELSATIESANAAINDAAEKLDRAGADLSGAAGSLSEKLGSTKQKLESASAGLADSAARLQGLSARLNRALTGDDAQMLRDIVGTNPSDLASAIAAPVKLERIAMYPADNFGSAMAPLYTTLALWIGALLIMVALKVHPSPKSLASLDNPTARQTFLGRFGVIALLSVMQSTSIALGNLLFLGVQAVNPMLYLICFWAAGLSFAFIIYTLVALFANLGKALSVILLIVQVSGGGGSFPLKLLPSFFQTMSPYLPITHAVNAMRAAMFGVYANDFWIELATLALFVVPLVILGLMLQAPLSKIVPKFVARVEKSKLM